jgi:hypothetical protein
MNRLLLAAASGVAIAVAGRALARGPAALPAPARALSEPEPREATRHFLMYVVIPLWLIAGLADWTCHRATKIEKTSGLKESLLHLLMLGEVGVPILAALFLQISAPVIGLMLGALALHQVTSIWDVSYTAKRREIPPIEQHVHTYLEMIPMMATTFVSVLHWPKVQELFGRRERRDMTIRLKEDPLPAPYIAATLGAVAVFAILPFLEEAWRCSRAQRVRKTP